LCAEQQLCIQLYKEQQLCTEQRLYTEQQLCTK
jgi:hypothetical protein